MKLTEDGALRSLVKESFFDFVKEFWSQIIHEPPVFNWHVQYLCDELQILAERVFQGKPKEYNLAVNVPPGSTKSTIFSQMFPAWVWTRMPHAQLIHISYAYMIAQKDSIRTRDIVQSDLYQKCFPELQLREDENTKGLFMNTKGGYRLSVGMGGAVTGQHGHFLVVDDPINPEESFSEAELRNANRWMETTLPTRKINKLVTPTILIQQRLHQADPTGEMLSKADGKNIKHICIPGELTEDVSPKELAAFYKDGLMDPIRLPREVLTELRTKTLGEYGFASQILQSPVPLGGGSFQVEKFNIMEQRPRGILRICRSWDKAGTEGGGAWSVGTLVAVNKENQIWILDVVRGQWGSTRREQVIVDTAEEDGDEVEVAIEIEGGSGGKESAEGTKDRLQKRGFHVFCYHPTGSKEARAYEYANQVGTGNVYLLNGHWVRAFKEEHRFFPHSKYKDQVDSASGGVNRIFLRKRVRIGGLWQITKS